MGVSVREKVNGSGIWWVFIRHVGKRASQQAGDKETADLAAAEMRKEIRTGKFDIEALIASRAPEVPKAEPGITLKEYYDKTVLPFWEATVAKATATRYDTSFRIHILPVLGDLSIESITRDRVKAFVVALIRKTAEKRTHGEVRQAEEPERRLSKDSIRLVVAALRAALTEAVEQGLVQVNPACKLGKLYRDAGAVHEEVDPFTTEEIPLLLTATLQHFGHEHYSLLLAALHTGMRASELAGLQWSDVDLRGRFLTVRRQFKDGVQSKTKTKKARKVDISDALLKELQVLRKKRQEQYLGRGKNELPPWVFLSPGNIIWEEGKPVGRTEGQPLDMVNFRNRVFLKACDKAGIRRRRLHDTRHTFASILLMKGESPVYVRDQLGHSSIKMTVDVYGHFIPGANRQAVNKLPSLSAPMASIAAGDR